MNVSPATWFKLFASCQIVRGRAASVIYDLDRAEFYDVPNGYVELLEMTVSHDIEAIKKQFRPDQSERIDAFFSQFVEREIGFYTNSPNDFPEIDFQWESPNSITNAIIEIEDLITFDLKSVVDQLNSLLCKAIQIRLLTHFTLPELLAIGALFEGTQVSTVEVLLPYDCSGREEELRELLASQSRVRRILMYGAPADKIVINETDRFGLKLLHFRKDIRLDDAEKIIPERFVSNISKFSESQGFNSGLNRKVSITRHGEIKNYINHQHVFGHIGSETISSVINAERFQEKWYVSNDKIETCCDCQYRYGCLSNSDIVQTGNKWVKLDMCLFDVSTNTWPSDVNK